MPHTEAPRRRPLAYVAAGSLYLLLSSILFLVWLSVDHVLVLLLSLSTVVAGIVDLSVGWPRLHGRRKPRTP